VDGEQVNTAMQAGSHYRSPLSRYQAVDLSSRIESAAPHTLVTMLYEELQLALAVMQRAADAASSPRIVRAHERATSILLTLEASLDHQNGGELAASLGAIYRQMRRRLTAARGGDGAAIAEVSEGVGNLATAWSRISA